MHAKYEVSISYGSKVIDEVKNDNRKTDKQTDRTKTICPRSFDPSTMNSLGGEAITTFHDNVV